MRTSCLILTFLILHILSQTSAQTSWSITETLDKDGRYNVTRWVNMEKNHIEFEVSVETTGFVGFGLSFTGDMVGADIVIGGILEDKSTYFSDRHATSRSTPIVDKVQNWNLISASEIAGVTTLRFDRVFHTCDDDDIPITEDTLKMIWSFGATDTIEYHGGANRGIVSVNLLDPPQQNPDMSGLQEWPVLIEDKMPSQDTAYWCSMHKAPDKINKKMFMVGYDAQLLSEAAETHTHHFVLHRCIIPEDEATQAILQKRVGQPGSDCQINLPDEPNQFCQPYMFVWAKGGQRTMFPEKVGFPIGEHIGKEYFMLEIHYDNPEKLSGVKFTTGLKVYYAEEREIDAGLMTIGHSIYYGHTIPPNSQNFVTLGHCPSECTQPSLPPTGIKIFNVLLHSHLSGRKLKIRQIRNGKELPWIAVDDNYDFNYQQNRPLREELTVLPGDHLIYECTTDTTWKNGTITIGDLGTRDEMCQVFVLYHPRINLNLCVSLADQNATLAVLGIEELQVNPLNGNNPIVTKPESMSGMTYVDAVQNVVNWTPRIRAAYQEAVKFPDHVFVCGFEDSSTEPIYGNTKYPYVQPYEPEDQCSKKDTTEVTETERTASTQNPVSRSTVSDSTTANNAGATWKIFTFSNFMITFFALILAK